MAAREAIQRRHLPNVALTTHEDAAVRFYDDLVKDRNVLINFWDRDVALSATAMANLAGVHRILGSRVGNDIFMYSISLNPRQDTPAALQAYLEAQGAMPGWLLLTGTESNVETLRHALGFAYPDPADDADRRNIVTILCSGSEPEMRWTHGTTLAAPRMTAHMVVADFGPDPTDPAARVSWYCKVTPAFA